MGDPFDMYINIYNDGKVMSFFTLDSILFNIAQSDNDATHLKCIFKRLSIYDQSR